MAAKKQPAAPRRTAARTPGKAAAPRTTKELEADAQVEVSPEELQKLISEAAYFRAKQRGFEPGHELEDWIQAEAEVMRRIEGRSA